MTYRNVGHFFCLKFCYAPSKHFSTFSCPFLVALVTVTPQLEESIKLNNKKPILLTVAIACFLHFTHAYAFLGKQDFVPSETGAFTNRGVVQGTKATEAQCNQATGAVWAKYDNTAGECIRYWEKGLNNGINKRVIFFFHGDILSGNSVLDKSYEKKSPATILSTRNNFFPDKTNNIHVAPWNVWFVWGSLSKTQTR
jgi:hypothetical protein